MFVPLVTRATERYRAAVALFCQLTVISLARFAAGVNTWNHFL